MSKVEAPRGYETMDVEWNVNESRSALHLAEAAPTGWQFYELNRSKDKAVVTYIRKKEVVKADVSATAWVSSEFHGRDEMEKVRDVISERLKGFIEDCIKDATGKPARDFHVTYNTTIARGFNV